MLTLIMKISLFHSILSFFRELIEFVKANDDIARSIAERYVQ